VQLNSEYVLSLQEPDMEGFMKNMRAGLLVAMFLALVPFNAQALSSASYKIAADAFPNGGGELGSTNYKISSLSGQPVVGALDSGSYKLHAGFYYIMALEQLLNKRAACIVNNSSALYAGFDGEGIWKSTDNGATWSAAATQPANRQIRGLVINPTTRTTLYAATYGGGIFKSVTSGDSWSACSGQPSNLNAVSLAIDPAGILYAGTEGGIFTSSDCSSWSPVNTGLTVDAATPPVTIAIDPATPATLYAGLDGGGIYNSSDGGGNWSPATTQPANLRVKALVIKPGDGTKLFASTYGGGVFKSSDGGDNWSACTNTNLTNLNVVSLTIDSSGKLYAGTEAGVFVSADGCGTWTAINGGLP
jgi:photosystem II stability/assembly factor-like uncharacterized protein